MTDTSSKEAYREVCEVPDEGFTMPKDGRKLLVVGADGAKTKGAVDEAASTAQGSYMTGLTLQLTLKRTGGAPWPARPFQISWTQDYQRITLLIEPEP